MSNDELAEKISKLPAWAREHIKRLEDRVTNTEPEMRRRAQEVAEGKLAYQRLRERYDAMEAILTCAAKGGHETAQAYVDRIINEYKSEENETTDQPVGEGYIGPRYIAWVSSRQFYLCTTLTQAAEWRQKTGATIYEPLGMTTAEKIAKEPEEDDKTTGRKTEHLPDGRVRVTYQNGVVQHYLPNGAAENVDYDND